MYRLALPPAAVLLRSDRAFDRVSLPAAISVGVGNPATESVRTGADPGREPNNLGPVRQVCLGIC
jgi:hypothetical protein